MLKKRTDENNTYKLICLVVIGQQRAFVLLLVLNKGLDIYVEALTGGALG